jgi:RHS repeat-associated protein
MSTPSFTTTAGAHTVKFVGRNTAGGDHTALIDEAKVTIAAATTSFVTGKTLAAQRADSPGWTGLEMQIGGQAVTVTTLGRYCAQGNSLSHELRLIQRSNNGLIASATVSMSGCTEGQTKYATLASPVTLFPNTAYVLVSYEVGADKFHDYSGSTLTTTSVATVLHGIYTTDGGQTWGAAGSTGNSYVPVDFQYITGGTAEISYLVSDQLGTPRMIFDQSGSLASTKRHDYLPFGEELFAGTGGRTSAQGYSASDGIRQKFTSKERDAETGLDYFGARYYGSTQGRFTSPDEFLNSGRLESPQTWNRYAYVLNNPLAFTDPSGFYEYADGTSDKDKKRFEEQLKNARAQLDKIKERYGADSKEYTDSKRALDAYGGVGEKNGVFVGFGKTSDGSPGETGGFFSKDGSTRSINVTIDLSKNKADNLLMGTIAHEGSHVQDRADLVNAILANPLEADAASAKFNITVGATETKAYTVQSVFAEFTYKNEQLTKSEGGTTTFRMEATQESAVITGTGVKVWNPSWAGADIAKIRSQRSAAIAEGLSKSSVYSDKLNKPMLR